MALCKKCSETYSSADLNSVLTGYLEATLFIEQNLYHDEDDRYDKSLITLHFVKA